MEKHSDLRNAKFSAEFTHRMARELWHKLTEKLNQTKGASKNWMSWRKTWQDIRCKGKKRLQNLKQQSVIEGVRVKAEMIESLTETVAKLEDKIMGFNGESAIIGHPETEEQFADPWHNHKIKEFNARTEESSSNFTILPETERPVEPCEIHGVPSDTYIKKIPENIGLSSRKSKKPKQKFASSRLDETIAASNKLVQKLGEKNQIKRAYYEKKFKLYEKEILAKEEYCKREIELREREVKAKELYYKKKLEILSSKIVFDGK